MKKLTVIEQLQVTPFKFYGIFDTTKKETHKVLELEETTQCSDTLRYTVKVFLVQGQTVDYWTVTKTEHSSLGNLAKNVPAITKYVLDNTFTEDQHKMLITYLKKENPLYRLTTNDTVNSEFIHTFIQL